jgi:polysaccharide export outer membrane protein
MAHVFARICLVALCLQMAGAVSLVSAQPAPAVTPLPQAPIASANNPAAGTTAGGSSAEYVLGPEDVIEVEVVGQPDKLRARVYTDGTIQLNLVGKITAAGKTPRELGAEIVAILKSGGFYANPVVNVEVSNYASRYVTVLGAVASPSLVPINRAYRLSEILARVGGVQATAADFLIVRPETGPEKRYLIADLATGDATKDPFVVPGDKIFSPVAEVFYISGQVNAPGSFPVRSDLTVRQAIARAGGLTASGSDKKVAVNRGGNKVKLKADDKVEPGDVLVIGERLF